MGWFEGWRDYFGKTAIILCFLFCALPVGVMTVLLTPPGQSPDEPAHMARAEGLLHGAILGVRKTNIDANTGKPEAITGVKVDWGLYQVSFGQTTRINNHQVITMEDLQTIRQWAPAHNKIFASIPNTAAYFPTAYLPAALGLGIGLAVNASPYTCFTLARFFMLAAFLALGVLALRIAAFGEALLLTVLLLPMTLFLASTLNEDGVLIAMVCLACAALTRGTRGLRVLGLAMFALFLGSKPPYLPLLAVFVLPLFGVGFWGRVRDAVVASVPVLGWVALISLFVLVPFAKPPYHPGPFYAGDRSIWLDHTDPAANLHILLADPARFTTLPVHTALSDAPQIMKEMIGVLGLLQIQLPVAEYIAWCVSGVTALLGLLLCARPAAVPGGAARMNFIAVSFLLLFTYWLMMISFYLSWSNVGIDHIDGMQGRYSLPLLPFLLFAIPWVRCRFTPPPLLPALPAVVMGIFDIGYLPIKLVWNYYLH